MTAATYEGKLLFPRLPSAPARQRLAMLNTVDTPDVAGTSAAQHPSAAPAPVGGHPASQLHLGAVRSSIREIAGQFGYPERLVAKDQAAFDRKCGTVLLQKMDIVTGDAASPDVWSFISLVLLPEIPFWRFPGAAEERYLGGLRNTFQRLWWRAWTFGPDLTSVPEGATPFGEDDFVQVMERPTVSGNERLARAFYSVVLESDLASLHVTRSELVRRLVIQIRARRSHVAVDALNDSQLVDLIRVVRDGM